MMIVAICDEGLSAAPNAVTRFGKLVGPNEIIFEEALAHALSRPDALPPKFSSLELHCTDHPYAVLSVMTADGMRTSVFGDLPEVETVDRLVSVSGSTLFAIASELAGKSVADVDHMLKGTK